MSPTVSIMQVGNEEGEPTLRRKESCQTYYFTQMVNDLLISISKKVFFIFVVSSRHLTHNSSDSRNWSNWMTSTVKKLFYINAGYWLGSTHRFLGYTPQNIFCEILWLQHSVTSSSDGSYKDPSALETLDSDGTVTGDHIFSFFRERLQLLLHWQYIFSCERLTLIFVKQTVETQIIANHPAAKSGNGPAAQNGSHSYSTFV